MRGLQLIVTSKCSLLLTGLEVVFGTGTDTGTDTDTGIGTDKVHCGILIAF